MKLNTCLVLDVWEGNPELDEATLKAAGIAGIGIRLNDMSGGHHKDKGFDKQWNEAINFVRFPYFVYNPWVNGRENFDWLKANMPEAAKSVAVDVEVKYSGISAATYAGDLVTFLNLCKSQGWKTIIYTAEWFLWALSSWPKVDYWWAQYPDFPIFFPGAETWEQVKAGLDNPKLSQPFNAAKCPGIIRMWQFGGDFAPMPGTGKGKIDINIFYGSEAELAAYFGAEPVVITPPTPQPAVVVNWVANGGALVRQFLQVKVTIGGASYICDVDQREPVVVPPPVTPAGPSLGLYRIKDDLEAGVPPRPYIRNGLPSTVPIFGGASTLKVPDRWVLYLRKIMTNKVVDGYLFRRASGWQNGDEFGVVRELTFSGNVVEVLSIEGSRAYIKTLTTDSPVFTEIIEPTEKNPHPLVQMFSIQYNNHLDTTTDGRFAYTLLMVRPNERPYIELANLAKI